MTTHDLKSMGLEFVGASEAGLAFTASKADALRFAESMGLGAGRYSSIARETEHGTYYGFGPAESTDDFSEASFDHGVRFMRTAKGVYHVSIPIDAWVSIPSGDPNDI